MPKAKSIASASSRSSLKDRKEEGVGNDNCPHHVNDILRATAYWYNQCKSHEQLFTNTFSKIKNDETRKQFLDCWKHAIENASNFAEFWTDASESKLSKPSTIGSQVLFKVRALLMSGALGSAAQSSIAQFHTMEKDAMLLSTRESSNEHILDNSDLIGKCKLVLALERKKLSSVADAEGTAHVSSDDLMDPLLGDSFDFLKDQLLQGQYLTGQHEDIVDLQTATRDLKQQEESAVLELQQQRDVLARSLQRAASGPDSSSTDSDSSYSSRRFRQSLKIDTGYGGQRGLSAFALDSTEDRLGLPATSLQTARKLKQQQSSKQDEFIKPSASHIHIWGQTDDVDVNTFYEHLMRVWTNVYNHPDGKLFQKPVSKSQARDYYDVIKHPMDLSKMLKKIKTMQYRSREDFRTDFELMWSNCVQYNTDPEHFARKAAANVKAYTDELLMTVPGEFVMQLHQHPQQVVQTPLPFAAAVSASSPGVFSVETPVSAIAHAAAATFAAAEERQAEAVHRYEQTKSATSRKSKPAPFTPLDTVRFKPRLDVLAPLSSKEEDVLRTLSEEQRKKVERDLASTDVFDSETRWHILTQFERVPFLCHLKDDLGSGKGFGDSLALVRTNDAMLAFLQSQSNSSESSSLCPEYSAFMGAVPGVLQTTSDEAPKQGRTIVPRRDLANKHVQKNLKRIHELKRSRSVKNSEEDQVDHLAGTRKQHLAPIADATEASAICRSAIGILLAHQGIDGIGNSALDIVEGLVQSVAQEIGSSLAQQQFAVDPREGLPAIVLRALRETMNVDNPFELIRSAVSDVALMSSKLDIAEKLLSQRASSAATVASLPSASDQAAGEELATFDETTEDEDYRQTLESLKATEGREAPPQSHEEEDVQMMDTLAIVKERVFRTGALSAVHKGIYSSVIQQINNRAALQQQQLLQQKKRSASEMAGPAPIAQEAGSSLDPATKRQRTF